MLPCLTIIEEVFGYGHFPSISGSQPDMMLYDGFVNAWLDCASWIAWSLIQASWCPWEVFRDNYEDEDDDEEPLFACAGLKAVCVSACAAVRLSWRTFYSTTRLGEGARIRDSATNTQTVLSPGNLQSPGLWKYLTATVEIQWCMTWPAPGHSAGEESGRWRHPLIASSAKW